ncbi:MAG: hypothetical protein ACREVI_05935 [Steroidobacteraceae bacterium]
MNISKVWSTALIASLLPVAAMATGGTSNSEMCNPAGTWSVNVTFPPESGFPPFHELLSLLPGGVVIETNSILHANSQDTFFGINGSPGQGAWKRRANCRIEFKVLKQVFDQTHQFLGFIRITVRAKISGNQFSNELADSNVDFIFGPDPDAPPSVMFGGSTSQGKRIKAN